MVEIGERPILWHVMKIYSAHGISDFVICLGYKGYMIKEYFAQYLLHTSDVTFDLASNSMQLHSSRTEPWRVTLIDTGLETQTGGRLKRVLAQLDPQEPFCMTYGDGVSDVDIRKLIAFHRAHGRLATVTGVGAPGRFGSLRVDGDRVTSFAEKTEGDSNWINGGFFVLDPKIGDYIAGDASVWEHEPLERLAHDDQLRAFFHRGFWQPMDTMRDRNSLQGLWEKGNAPWQTWT
jgi:glucose-1-phosphate cytidylyltransferase